MVSEALLFGLAAGVGFGAAYHGLGELRWVVVKLYWEWRRATCQGRGREAPSFQTGTIPVPPTATRKRR